MQRATPTRIILLALLLAAGAAVKSQPERATFVPPHAVFASDIEYPINSIASGLVTLSVGLSESGHIDNLQTVRDIPSLTAPSLVAVNGWTFAPASLNGQGVASSISVNLLFNPLGPALGPVPLPGAASVNGDGKQEYVPPEVASAVYAVYPVNVTAAGPVVFDVRVGKSGQVRGASPIYTTPSLTTPALSAVQKWRFTPGRFRGSPVTADIVVVFVFPSPTITTPLGLLPGLGASWRWTASLRSLTPGLPCLSG